MQEKCYTGGVRKKKPLKRDKTANKHIKEEAFLRTPR